jgi:predicted CopG family antitoxin
LSYRPYLNGSLSPENYLDRTLIFWFNTDDAHNAELGGPMKKRLNITIDDDVYGMMKRLPMAVSISELISWFLKGMLKEINDGPLTQEEFDKWMESTPEGKDFAERASVQFGPTVKKMFAAADKFKKTVRPGRKK